MYLLFSVRPLSEPVKQGQLHRIIHRGTLFRIFVVVLRMYKNKAGSQLNRGIHGSLSKVDLAMVRAIQGAPHV